MKHRKTISINAIIGNYYNKKIERTPMEKKEQAPQRVLISSPRDRVIPNCRPLIVQFVDLSFCLVMHIYLLLLPQIYLKAMERTHMLPSEYAKVN